MNIIPVGHRLSVKPFTLEQVDDAYSSARKMGIEIIRPNEKREDASIDKGVVLAIGAECWPDQEPWCKVGDVIYYAKFSPKFIEDPVTKESIGILNDQDVVCVVKEDK